MKGRKLKPLVEAIIKVVCAVQMIIIVSVHDFELSFIPWYILLMASVVFNVWILNKYGEYGA